MLNATVWAMYGTASFHRILMDVLSLCSQIYPIAALLLFSVLCYASASIFNSICEQLKNVNESAMQMSAQLSHSRLQKWKRLHQMAFQTVRAINDCFGWTLFLSTISIYIITINTTFNIIGLDHEKLWSLINVSYILTGLLQLTFLWAPIMILQSKV